MIPQYDPIWPGKKDLINLDLSDEGYYKIIIEKAWAQLIADKWESLKKKSWLDNFANVSILVYNILYTRAG